MRVQQTDVLIVGGGPVGLMLSIELSWRGIAHILIDQGARAARAVHPRMDQVSIRTMEHLRRLGNVADIEAAGFPRSMRRDIVFTTGVLGHELEREPVECDALRQPPSFSPQKHELCPQNFFDPTLQLIAERSTFADIRYDHQLLDFIDHGESIIASIEHADSGRQQIEAQYLAGCDGAGSDVARRLGITMDAATTLAQSTNIFIKSDELTGRAAARPGYRYILLDQNGIWASMINMNGRDVWRLQVLGGQNRRDWKEDEIQAAVAKAVGEDVPYSIISVVPWARRELVVEHFSKGRCFLVGDAAHQLSPTGGYGMNTGIAEAVDLAWKLEATLKGWGGPALLASYETERRPVALRNAKRSTVNFERMRSVPPELALMELTEAGTAARTRVGPLVKAALSEEWDSMGIHLGYNYADSPLVIPDGSPSLPDDAAHYEQTARPGARAPHAWLREGKSTLDLLGRGFVLMQFSPDADPKPLMRAAALRNVPVRLEQIDNPAIARLYEHAMVLVRPDGHVAWRGETASADALSIIDRIRGAETITAHSAVISDAFLPGAR
jgi:2-polyprenyl-6-methoxyphenol hydroxylase-like FAD-dependent oxidoreductase